MKNIPLIAALVSALAAIGAQASTLTIQSVYTPTPYVYTASNGPADNIKDGNLNTYWNGGTYSDWVEADFGNIYVFDKIELYGAFVGLYRQNNYTLSISSDGMNWAPFISGSYHLEPSLTLGTLKYGAVHTWTTGGPQGRYIRYAQSSGPEWAYLGELLADGHLPTATDPGTPSTVPLPAALPLMASGIGILGFAARRKKSASA